MFVREQYDYSRFWELFRPNTNNFQFWLGVSAFSFFGYQTLYQSNPDGMWSMILHQIVPWAFVVAAFVAFGAVVLLFIFWIFRIGMKSWCTIRRKNGKRTKSNSNDIRK